ncbi:uncharacterized protein [Spinacia oleracea]|uniref:Replication factor A C-terminal domain-containing protein n=1 Tax=Spinacia oleracea TaxID=3562 RepID=A0A9R0J8T2_SPIOL|nr:uncharacterized protein LOC110802415 [Spinacia oleracea]
MVDVPLQQIVRIEATQPESIEEAMVKNRKTIKEVQQLYMEGEENEEHMNTYTCVEKITFIHDQECGWMYTSCNNCKSRVDENQYNNKCQDFPEFPINRYRIIATIDDGNATMTVAIFDKDVEKIIANPIASMMKIYDQEKGVEKVSNELQQCVGKTCTLKLKVNNKSYIQELTAIKVFHVETEEKITTKRHGKEKLKEIKKRRANQTKNTRTIGSTHQQRRSLQRAYHQLQTKTQYNRRTTKPTTK